MQQIKLSIDDDIPDMTGDYHTGKHFLTCLKNILPSNSSALHDAYNLLCFLTAQRKKNGDPDDNTKQISILRNSLLNAMPCSLSPNALQLRRQLRELTPGYYINVTTSSGNNKINKPLLDLISKTS